MSASRGAWWLGVAIAIVTPRLAFAEGRALQHDPFARPSFGALPNAAAPAGRPGAARAAIDPKPALNLQAVMVAGPASMANVDGVMVRVGDTVRGYRLLAVHDRGAVFEKNKAQFIVPLQGTKPDPARARVPGGLGSDETGAQPTAANPESTQGKREKK